MKIDFESLLVYSETKNKYFFTEFSDHVNIVTGKNTSGKSTLIQSIIYSFGINDGRQKLSEILGYNILFRLSLSIGEGKTRKKLSFIRDSESILIVDNENKVLRFDGINADNSLEHIKLKSTISSIFNFNLILESKGELKPAPIECMLLPYYVSQSVGWVYLRDSFSSLSFYKNFKEDYLDYYLGITSSVDRLKRQELRNRRLELENEIAFLETVEAKDEELKLSKLLDEEFKGEATNYIENYSSLRQQLVNVEEQHIKLCNNKSLLKNRASVLRRVKQNLSKQKPEVDKCPVCVQTLPHSVEAIYEHEQNFNDTQYELQQIKLRIKEVQSQINSTEKKIEKLNNLIESDYSLLKNYSSSSLTFDSWIGHKSNIRLIKNVDESIGRKTKELNEVLGNLSDLGDEEDLYSLRATKERDFTKLFQHNLSILGVPLMGEERYNELYKINSFPYQGVELHKTVMAYHFSLNQLISKTKNIHRFPFVLDAIMKEDIDPESRAKIFRFITNSKPKDTQTLFSISESMEYSKSDNGTLYSIESVNEEYFDSKAKVIRIGDGDSERAFLSDYNGEQEELISSTLDLLYQT